MQASPTLSLGGTETEESTSSTLAVVQQQYQQQVAAMQEANLGLRQMIMTMGAEMHAMNLGMRQSMLPSILPQGGVFSQIPGHLVQAVAWKREFGADGGYSESFNLTADPMAAVEAMKAAQPVVTASSGGGSGGWRQGLKNVLIG